jgi:hypothetical protein
MANNSSWLNISQVSGGTGETALSLTALTNTSLEPKTATITARNTQYNVSDTTTVTIQGFQPTLTLSRSTLRFDSTGGTATFTVYSNTSWTINFPPIVHSYSTSAGTGNMEVSVVLAPNPDTVAKIETGTIQDDYNVNQLYLTIVQESFIVELSVYPLDDINYPNTGGTSSITIDCNADWELEFPNWVIPSVVSGESGITTVELTAGCNGPTDRSGTVTVYSGSKYVTINVNQPFYIEPYLTITPSAYTFSYLGGDTDITINSFPAWTAEIISTGETRWGEDIAVEAILEVPSATTLNLGQTGVFVNGVLTQSSTYTFVTGGTYVLLYPYVSSTAPNVGNTYLKEVRFYETITALPSGCLCGCTNLSSVTIYGDLQEMPEKCFYGCSSLKSITMYSKNAPAAGDTVFENIATGGTLTYPSGSDYSSWLCGIYPYLGFYRWNGGRPGLIKAYYNFSEDGYFNDIGYSYAFKDYGGTAELCDENGELLPSSTVTKNGNHLFYRGEVTVGGPTVLYIRTPKVIPDDMFAVDIAQEGWYNGEDELIAVEIPEGITKIGNWAFRQVWNLSSVTLPSSLEEIGERCFNQCGKLTNLSIGSGSKLKKIGALGFADCTLLSSFTIPDTIEVFGNGCFTGTSIQGGLHFPKTVSSIGSAAFMGLSLTAVSFANNIASLSIDATAFADCTSLENIFLPYGITSIGNESFRNAPISAIYLPETLTNIGKNAFSGTSLVTVRVPDSIVELCGMAFDSIPTLASITYGTGCTSIVKGLNYAFKNAPALQEIHFLSENEPKWSFSYYDSHTRTTKYCYAFSGLTRNGIFYYPKGSDYSAIASSKSYAGGKQGGSLGYFGWTGREDGLSVFPLTVSVADIPEEETISIKSSSSWTISNSLDWVHLSQDSGTSGETNVILSIDNNLGGPRDGSFIVTDGENSFTVSVTQEGLSFGFEPTTITAENSGETIQLYLKTPYNWNIIGDTDWITLTSYSGNGGYHTIGVTVDKNEEETLRQMIFTVTDGSSSGTLKIVQGAPKLPDVPFLCNYNAKEMETSGSNKIFPKTYGQLFSNDIVISGSVTANTEAGYVHLGGSISTQQSFTWSSASINPFNRYNTSTGRTFTAIYKTSNFSNSIVGNRSNTGGTDNYNYMLREGSFHTSSQTLQFTPSDTPYIIYVRVNADGTCERKCVTTGQIATGSSTTYGNASKGIAFFAGMTDGVLSEYYAGDFYWLYISNEALTDEEIQQVIDYNELK